MIKRLITIHIKIKAKRRLLDSEVARDELLGYLIDDIQNFIKDNNETNDDYHFFLKNIGFKGKDKIEYDEESLDAFDVQYYDETNEKEI